MTGDCLLKWGGGGGGAGSPTPLLASGVRAIQSFVGHIITIFSDYNKVETSYQQIE